MHKEAYLFTSLADNAVQCQACEHFCVIEEGHAGKCGVRRNLDGVLTLMVYGKPVAIHVDPIEKKPLFHFMPRSNALSVGTYGCNFRCSFCQNWQISQKRDLAETEDAARQTVTSEALVRTCVNNDIPLIAYTYNEPTVFFEYTYDTAKLAHEQSIKNVYVSNGFMSQALLDKIEPYLDGINVDLKAFTDAFYRERCGGRIGPVKRNIAYIARETDIWLEVTTLLIPGLNDSDEELSALAGWLADVDPNIPWHVSAFHPDYQLLDRPPTSMPALTRAYEVGKQAGLHYVYVGNVMDADHGSTYCPHCGHALVKRHWYDVDEVWETLGECPQCGEHIFGVWS